MEVNVQVNTGPNTVPLSSIGVGNTFKHQDGWIGLVTDLSQLTGYTVPTGMIPVTMLATGVVYANQPSTTQVYDVTYTAGPSS